jgi:hypothetical protein
MAFNPFKILKSLLVSEEGTLTPKQVEIVPGGTASTKTTITSSQTTNKTITLPDATDTLVGKATTDSLTNKSLVDSSTAIVDNSDATKQIKFDAAGTTGTSTTITSSQTANRTLTLPDTTDTLATATQVTTVQTNLDNHIADATDAHAASAITNTPAGTIAATTVQAAVNELDTDIQGHITDATAAHAASAVAVTPAGNLASTDVQSALVELQTDINGLAPAGNYITALTGDVVAAGPGSVAATIQAGAVDNAKIAAGVDAAKIADGSVSNAEFQRLNGVSSDIQTQLDARLALAGGTMLGDLILNADPSASLQAATKQYVDSVAAGLDPKQAVRCATTVDVGGVYANAPSNGRFTGAATTIDDIPLNIGDRVLIKDQTDAKQNGIYVYDGAGQFTRSTDMDGSPASEVSAGNYTFATEGTINVSSGFVLTGDGLFTLNTDNLVFTQFSGSGGASAALDNLTTPTAINTALLPNANNTIDLGSPANSFRTVYAGTNVSAAGRLTSPTGTATTVGSQNSAAASDATTVVTGNAAAGNSGDITIQTGTATGTRGDVVLNAKATRITSGPLNITQGQTAQATANQQSITIPSSNEAEGLIKITASDSTDRYVLTAASTGLPQAPNYILNGDAEGKLATSSTIFVTYSDRIGSPDASIPTDAQGGAPVGVSSSMTIGLSGNRSYLLSKDNADRQGEGWYIPFNMDIAGAARVFSIKFDYIPGPNFVGGTNSTNSDVTVWIYDVTSAKLIQPSSYKLLAAGGSSLSDQFQAEFQTSAGGSEYKLVFHVASTNPNSYTITVDNIVCSPSQYVFGTPISDWISYTPTFTGFGTPSGVDFKYKRMGDEIHVVGTFTSVSPTAVTGKVSLPSGLSIDANKVTSTQRQMLGILTRAVSGATNTFASTTVGPYAVVEDTTSSTTEVFFSNNTNTTANHYVLLNGNSLTNNGDNIMMSFRVPISGWSSSVQMSDSTSTRIVSARASITAAAATTAGNPFNFNNVEFDTHSAISTGATTWKYTAPVSGTYRVSSSVYVNASITVVVYKNGSNHSVLFTATGPTAASGSTLVQLNAGDYIDIRGSALATPQSVGAPSSLQTSNWVTVDRISGPSQIAASETVAARYKTSAAQSIPNATNTIVNFGTSDFDTHNATTTGASWKFTAPISGTYRVSAVVQYGSGNYNPGTLFESNLFKNGAAYASLGFVTKETGTATVTPTLTGSTLIQLNAGDYIDIRTYQNNGGNSPLSASAIYNHINIERVGNRG